MKKYITDKVLDEFENNIDMLIGIIHPDHKQRYLKEQKTKKNFPKTIEYKLKPISGEKEIWVEDVTHLSGEYYFGYISDITERKRKARHIEELDIEKYIFTTGKVQNAEFIKHKLDMVFKDIFNVPMIGFKKTDKNAYLKLCEELDLKPSQVMFIDDTEENINAAKEAGLHAVVYHDNNQILNSISEWLT